MKGSVGIITNLGTLSEENIAHVRFALHHAMDSKSLLGSGHPELSALEKPLFEYSDADTVIDLCDELVILYDLALKPMVLMDWTQRAHKRNIKWTAYYVFPRK